ncbi:VC0807 family protein [Kitasatospora sp. NPDC051853]|uniref:VC0807 family protein n=1 Tax=Kitasatospora sp. NPDC051853 TaxID=3364058 RepID=UPI0037B8B76F
MNAIVRTGETMTESQLRPSAEAVGALPAPPERGGAASVLWQWGPFVLFGVVLPLITYNQLVDHGVGTAAALLLSALWPAAETVGMLLVRRHVDEMGVLSLTLLALTLLSSLAFNSPRMILVKDSALTGLFGLVMFASLLAPRPLCFYLGRKFATDGSPGAVAWWNGLWKFAGFRRTQKIITTVWGTAFTVEAVLRIALAYLLPTSVMVTLNTVLPMVVLAALITWTIRYGRRAGERGRAAASAASTA